MEGINMSKILVKVKKDSIKDNLITSAGQILYKDKFVEVRDDDDFVKTYILQDRVELKDIEEKVKIKKNDD
jgi:hypothetical protein